MKYLLSIYDDEAGWASTTPEQAGEIMDAYNAFTEEITTAGVMLAGDGLQPTATATTVRVRDGERLLTDGPFAETKEQLGGFYLIDVDSLDEALEWAAKIPAVHRGSIEVRPVMDYEAMRQGSPAAAETAS